MARLGNLRPSLGTVSTRLSLVPEGERARSVMRDQTQPWRRWYKTARWQKLRWQVLARDLFTCQMPGCGRIERDTSQLVADHKTPHRGDETMFWDAGNLQCLCKACHDGRKQSQERGGGAVSFHPEWIRASQVPLTIVCGPPCSGKSHYVAERAGPHDLVIDLDQIASALSGEPLHRWSRDRWLGAAVRKRNSLLGSLARRSAEWPAAWFIVSEPRAEHRAWWDRKLKPRRIVVLEVPMATCMARAAADDRQLDATRAVVASWWTAYSVRAGDERVTAAA